MITNLLKICMLTSCHKSATTKWIENKHPQCTKPINASFIKENNCQWYLYLKWLHKKKWKWICLIQSTTKIRLQIGHFYTYGMLWSFKTCFKENKIWKVKIIFQKDKYYLFHFKISFLFFHLFSCADQYRLCKSLIQDLLWLLRSY